jgi:Asp-tRNA(Asn)/Glu-tRNA(Gln) amidotransferase A subunit family amidase
MRAFAQVGAGITALDYLRANQARAQLSAQLAAFFEKYDLLVTPTLAVPPFEIHTRPREIAGRKIHPIGWLPFTYPFNLTGNPAASVPCGWTDDGLPIGLQIVGRRFADALVLQAPRLNKSSLGRNGGQRWGDTNVKETEFLIQLAFCQLDLDEMLHFVQHDNSMTLSP